MRVRNLPKGMGAKQWVRHELDRLGIGREISEFRWGSKTVKLPPSTLKKKPVLSLPKDERRPKHKIV
jgi:hypothetical protein